MTESLVAFKTWHLIFVTLSAAATLILTAGLIAKMYFNSKKEEKKDNSNKPRNEVTDREYETIKTELSFIRTQYESQGKSLSELIGKTKENSDLKKNVDDAVKELSELKGTVTGLERYISNIRDDFNTLRSDTTKFLQDLLTSFKD